MRLRPFATPPLAAAALLVAACGDGIDTWDRQPQVNAADAAAEAGYMAPPAVTAARLDGEAVRIEGSAAPGAQVRIASPTGAAVAVRADGDGRWGATLEPTQPVELFGLSMTEGERAAQAEGYVMVTARGQVAQLRAGAGAVILSEGSSAPRILALDYDRDGGAVVSGVARPGAALGLRVDRSPRGEARADRRGRFSIPLSEPLEAGIHEVEVAGEGGEDVLRVEITPAAPLEDGPYAGGPTPFGWRVDWMPPGGGVQTTLIFERPPA